MPCIFVGLDNMRASEPCEADVRGTQVSLKNTPVSLKSTPVSLNSTQVRLNSSPVSLMVSIYVGGFSCLACLACFVHASHVCLTWLAWLACLARWLAHWPHSIFVTLQTFSRDLFRTREGTVVTRTTGSPPPPTEMHIP